MKERLKDFKKIKAVYLNDKIVLGYTIFEDYAYFKYQDNDGVKSECVFFKDVVESTAYDGIYHIEQGFRKEGKSAYIFTQPLIIKIKHF